jgi:hypothetical protein
MEADTSKNGTALPPTAEYTIAARASEAVICPRLKRTFTGSRFPFVSPRMTVRARTALALQVGISISTAQSGTNATDAKPPFGMRLAKSCVRKEKRTSDATEAVPVNGTSTMLA